MKKQKTNILIKPRITERSPSSSPNPEYLTLFSPFQGLYKVINKKIVWKLPSFPPISQKTKNLLLQKNNCTIEVEQHGLLTANEIPKASQDLPSNRINVL